MVFNRKLHRHNYYLTHRDLELSRANEYNKKHRQQKCEYSRKYHSEHKEKILVRMKKYRNQNKYRIRYIKKKNYDDVRYFVISYYSDNLNNCAICGESIFKFLSIDHINGGGTKQRKNLKLNSLKLYRWLMKNGFPEDYRVLCFNCNMGYMKFVPNPKDKRSIVNRENRRISIGHYSNQTFKCACCGCAKYDSLTFDHINNDGAEHRRNTVIRYIGTWLVKNNFPSGFQILCYNCNMGKFLNGGICPHNDQKY